MALLSKRPWIYTTTRETTQICTNLQPDYYMKYYRMQVVQTRSSVIKRRDRPGIGRRQQRECLAHGSACLSLP